MKLAASVCCFSSDQSVLLVRRANPPSQGLWAFPGGKVDAGETPKEASIRELHEETGLKVPSAELWRISRPQQGALAPNYEIHVFFASQEVTPVTARTDATDAEWFKVDEALRLPLAAGIDACLRDLQRAN
ncbi:NUDIX domain-containing protein [Pseudovibrio exalbescens]|uniref:NUDIX hydrolase n=1 Tax=Pseudovibrio exalbescens TaxID=197461 RepID=UPI002365DED1|nr:NUDIX domain-containing protein [Pseudovibrio exalbescens]MDD7911210.1 NUDIX domain-containing protein [Pseudovibrio exalbescens]